MAITLIPSVHGLTYRKIFSSNSSLWAKLLESRTAPNSWGQSMSQLSFDSISGQGWIIQPSTAHQHSPQTLVSMGRKPWHSGQEDPMACSSYNKSRELDPMACYGYGEHPAVRNQLCTDSIQNYSLWYVLGKYTSLPCMVAQSCRKTKVT